MSATAAPISNGNFRCQPDFGSTGLSRKSSVWVSLSRGGVAASNPEWFREKLPDSAKRVLYKPNYYRGFVESVRDRTPSVAPIGDAVRSDALSHLSLLAIKSGGEVVWDPKAYRIVSPDALNSQMTAPARGDWKVS